MHKYTLGLLALFILPLLLGGCGAPPPSPTLSPPSLRQETSPPETPTPVPAPSPTTTPDPLADLTAALEGLSFQEFMQVSYRQLLARDPEQVISLGLSQEILQGEMQFTDISPAYQKVTYQLQNEILDQLRGYERQELNQAEQIAYDTYEWYLNDAVTGYQFRYYSYPITHLVVSQPYRLIHLFQQGIPVQDLSQAKTYLAQLARVEEKLSQLEVFLEIQKEQGITAPKYIYRLALQPIAEIAHASPSRTPFYQSLEEQLSPLSSIPPDQKTELLSAAKKEIEDSILPAFLSLEETIRAYHDQGSDQLGVWQHPDGGDYYRYLIQHHTTTNMTPGDIHELGKRELNRIHGEMEVLFAQLGYPEEESLSKRFTRVANDGGHVFGEEIVAAYQTLIANARPAIEPYFALQPETEVVVRGGPIGDFYIPPPLDGSHPGYFYATVYGKEPTYAMPTLVYHETIPGHHFQIALARESENLTLFQRTVQFTGFAEGWALYAEQFMAEIGIYEGDIYGQLGKLQAEAFRATRLVVDTGLHAQGWSYEKALTYMIENTGLDPDFVNFEISRYGAWPAQALAYTIGRQTILDLRDQARAELGPEFDPVAFHETILENGSVPLPILETIVQNWISSQLKTTP